MPKKLPITQVAIPIPIVATERTIPAIISPFNTRRETMLMLFDCITQMKKVKSIYHVGLQPKTGSIAILIGKMTRDHLF